MAAVRAAVAWAAARVAAARAAARVTENEGVLSLAHVARVPNAEMPQDRCITPRRQHKISLGRRPIHFPPTPKVWSIRYKLLKKVTDIPRA